MKRLLRHLIHDLYPGEPLGRELSPEQEERQRQRGCDLAKLKPWESGRIGKIESEVHRALFWADINKTELTTGDLVREVYCNSLSHKLYGKDGPPPKVKHWMYERVRLAAATFANRVGGGRGRGGIRWRLRPDHWDTRRRKTARDAARRTQKRKRE